MKYIYEVTCFSNRVASKTKEGHTSANENSYVLKADFEIGKEISFDI
jgi:hypothetical protein